MYELSKIHTYVSSLNKKKPLLLVLHSPGGKIEQAYLISKCCRSFSDGFIVVVPRQAKSAATLIALGADEIHMGPVSELGPIDPQIGGFPALGLRQGVVTVAELCKDYPEAGDMLAKYLSATVPPQILGYTDRISESAAQYAEVLLRGKEQLLPEGETPESIGGQLVYKYKAHGFVIDENGAQALLGDKIVKSNTDEYEFAVQLQDLLTTVDFLCDIRGFNFSLVGGAEDILFMKRPSSSSQDGVGSKA